MNIEKNNDLIIDSLLPHSGLLKRMFSTEFVSEYCGRVSYVQLVLNKPCNVRAAMSMREIVPIY